MQIYLTTSGQAWLQDQITNGTLPSLRIVLGSSVNYTPSPTQTALQGSVVYTSGLIHAQVSGMSFLNYVLNLGADAPVLNYGEIGLLRPDTNALVGVGSFSSMQSNATDGVVDASTISLFIDATSSSLYAYLLQLDNAGVKPAEYLSIDSLPQANLLQGALVVVPNPVYPAETNQFLTAISQDGMWSVGGYMPYAQMTVTNSSTTWVEAIPTLDYVGEQTYQSSFVGQYVFQIYSGNNRGYCRIIESTELIDTRTYRLNLKSPLLAAIPTGTVLSFMAATYVTPNAMVMLTQLLSLVKEYPNLIELLASATEVVNPLKVSNDFGNLIHLDTATNSISLMPSAVKSVYNFVDLTDTAI